MLRVITTTLIIMVNKYITVGINAIALGYMPMNTVSFAMTSGYSSAMHDITLTICIW